MEKHELPINLGLNIRSDRKLFKNGQLATNNRWLVLNDPRLNIRLRESKQREPFAAWSIDEAFRIYLGDLPVGERLNHGNSGKMGLTYPAICNHWFPDELSALDGVELLKTYFYDLYRKAFYGPKALKAGIMRDHHFLMNSYVSMP